MNFRTFLNEHGDPICVNLAEVSYLYRDSSVSQDRTWIRCDGTEFIIQADFGELSAELQEMSEAEG